MQNFKCTEYYNYWTKIINKIKLISKNLIIQGNNKMMKMILSANMNQMKWYSYINRVEFKSKPISRERKEHFIINQNLILQENRTVLHVST